MMNSRLCDDWSILTAAEVEIWRDGRHVRTGVVDLVMADFGFLWLAGDYRGHRRLFEKSEGFEVWIKPCHIQSGE
jgi:hypothetical protein